MKTQNFPILRTHIANIALNKQIALPFLLSPPQRTSGLTEYSEESLINDKLFVASWMISTFMDLTIDEDFDPWVRLPEWEPPVSTMSGMHTIHEYDELIETIREGAKGLGPLWSDTNKAAVFFMKKVVAQAQECIWYTNQRLAAIGVLNKVGVMGSDDPHAIMDAGIAMAAKLSSSPVVMAVGYLMVKNEMNSKRVLAASLLDVIIEFLVEKAVEEGYTKPLEETA